MHAELDHEGRLRLIPQTLTEEVALMRWRADQVALLDEMLKLRANEPAVMRGFIDRRILFCFSPESKGPKSQLTGQKL